jgi:hypothetical protein
VGGHIKLFYMEIIEDFKSKMLFEVFRGSFKFKSSFLTQLVIFWLELMSEMNIYFHFKNTKVKQISIFTPVCYFCDENKSCSIIGS